MAHGLGCSAACRSPRPCFARLESSPRLCDNSLPLSRQRGPDFSHECIINSYLHFSITAGGWSISSKIPWNHLFSKLYFLTLISLILSSLSFPYFILHFLYRFFRCEFILLTRLFFSLLTQEFYNCALSIVTLHFLPVSYKF